MDQLAYNDISAAEAHNQSVAAATKALDDELTAIFAQIRRSTPNYIMGFTYTIHEANYQDIKSYLEKAGYTISRLDEIGDPSSITIRW